MFHRTSGRRRADRNGIVACAAALLLAAGGCSVYDPDLVQGGGGPGQLPLRPPSNTSSAEDSETLVFAFHEILLNQNDPNVNPGAWKDIGLNLDGLSTGSGTGQVECLAPGGTPVPDGNHGIDNVLGADLWPQVLTIPALQPLGCEIKVSHAAGHGTLLLRIEKYNGQPDDSQVVATLAPAVDGVAAGTDTGLLTWDGFDLKIGMADAPGPGWVDGDHDVFYLNPRAFYASGDPKVRDQTAYVVDNTLVFKVSGTGTEFELITETRSVPIVLSEGYIVAPMDDAHENVVDGFLAGRFPIVNLVNVGAPIGLCDTTAFQNIYRSMGDILVTPRLPGEEPDPMAECDAISMGVGFQAKRAIWQGLAPTEQPAPVWCDTQAAPLPGC